MDWQGKWDAESSKHYRDALECVAASNLLELKRRRSLYKKPFRQAPTLRCALQAPVLCTLHVLCHLLCLAQLGPYRAFRSSSSLHVAPW